MYAAVAVCIAATLLSSVDAYSRRVVAPALLGRSNMRLSAVTISAAMVNELRKLTDAPMMECKKALGESQGDMKRAEEIIRVKLGSKASKVGSRIAAEGLVVAAIEGNVGVVFEANCETDFVSKNPDFVSFSNACVSKVMAAAPADVPALLQLDMDGRTVEETRTDLVGKVGENMSVRRFKRYETPFKLASYMHGKTIGVMVEYEGDEQAAKDVCMVRYMLYSRSYLLP